MPHEVRTQSVSSRPPHVLADIGCGDRIGLDELSDNLAPKGWLALARLLKADLLDENDRIVYATESGEELAPELLGAPGSSPTSGGDAG